jgi:hypothetical protein
MNTRHRSGGNPGNLFVVRFCARRLRGMARAIRKNDAASIVPMPSRDCIMNSGNVAVIAHDPRASLAEQLTLNQRVQGSSPCAPTIKSMT